MARPTPHEIERELRRRLSEKDYRLLQSRLTGAVKAIDTLASTAADLIPLMLSSPLAQAAAQQSLPHDIQASLHELVAALLGAAAQDRAGHVDRRRLLRLVDKVTRGR